MPSEPRLLARHIFLTGQPGVGKTTLACASVQGVPACGFYTAECRSASGERQGFDVVVLGSDERGPLARLGSAAPSYTPTVVKVTSDSSHANAKVTAETYRPRPRPWLRPCP